MSMLLLILGGGGCASGEFHRSFEAGDHLTAVRAFDADSGLGTDERALFRAGLLFASPTHDGYDPDRAEALLTRLLELHPGTDRRAEALLLLSLLGDRAEVQREAARRERALTRELELLARERAGLEEQLAWVHTMLERQQEDREWLFRMVARLENDLASRDGQIEELRDELDQLKAIDLRTLRNGDSGG